jgi:hypothetical protein
MFAIMRTSNITKIRVFIDKPLNLIFGAKIYGMKGRWIKECCTMRNSMDSAVCLVLVRQIRLARH